MTDDQKKKKRFRWLRLWLIRMERWQRDTWLERQW